MKARKAFVAAACAFLLVVGSVAATMAYLTSTTEVVQNTFTIGKVEIDLDEANVNEYGAEYVKGDEGKTDNENREITVTADAVDRVKSNEYKLVPGHAYVKDPTVTVKDTSEPCYVRMIVTVNDYNDLFNALNGKTVTDAMLPCTYGDVVLLQNLVSGWDSATWLAQTPVVVKEADDGRGVATYEFRYFDTTGNTSIVDARNGAVILDDLFEGFTLPPFIDETSIKTLDLLKISVEAHAIQADTFADANAAWAAYDAQKA